MVLHGHKSGSDFNMKTLLLTVLSSVSFSALALFVLSPDGFASAASITYSGGLTPDLTFQIPIPGLPSVSGADITSGKALALYIGSAHRWLVGFALVLAVLAMTWGGVQWLLSRGESGKIQEARKVIWNALFGMLIALGSYIGLAIINPDLVSFKPLSVKPIQPINLELEEVHAPSGVINAGAGCVKTTSTDVLSIISSGKIASPADKAQQIRDGKIDERILGAIKTVTELCPQAGTVITSLVRPAERGVSSDHTTGLAVDIGGTICGGTPQELCTNGATLIKTLKAQGYEVGTWDACYGSFVDRGKNKNSPHLHIEASPCPRTTPPPTTIATSAAEEDRPDSATTSVAADPSACAVGISSASTARRSIPSGAITPRGGTTCDASRSIELELQSTGYAIRTYTPLGFPPPLKIRKITNAEVKKQWTEVSAAIEAASQSTGVDPGIIGMYAWHESDFNYFQDNCDDTDYKVNTPCDKWDGSKWQVGLGVHTEQRVYLKEAVEKMYTNASPQKISEIGQNIINESQKGALIGKTARPMKIITTFPALPIETIIEKAEHGTSSEKETYRIYVTTLMKDPKIGAFLIAKHFQRDLGLDAGLANEMKGWSPVKDKFNPQDISDYIAGYQNLRKEIAPSSPGYGDIRPE